MRKIVIIPEKTPKVIKLIGNVKIRKIVPIIALTMDKITAKINAETKRFSPVMLMPIIFHK